MLEFIYLFVCLFTVCFVYLQKGFKSLLKKALENKEEKRRKPVQQQQFGPALPAPPLSPSRLGPGRGPAPGFCPAAANQPTPSSRRAPSLPPLPTR